LIIMRALVRRTVTMLAVYTIALHTVLWVAAAPFTSALSVDPFTVICHGEASAPTDPAPIHSPFAPARVCDHCNLCSTTTLLPTPDTLPVDRLEPVRTLRVLHPANIARHDDIAPLTRQEFLSMAV
jgi:hypothetical protein